MLVPTWAKHNSPHRYEKEAEQGPKKKKKGAISHDFRDNLDGIWELGIDCQRLKAKMWNSGAYDFIAMYLMENITMVLII